MRPEGWLPRMSPATVIGVLLFICFVGPSVFHPPLPLPRGRGSLAGSDDDASARSWTGSFVQVPKSSHAYLQPLFPGHTESTFEANVSAEYTDYIAEHAAEVRWGARSDRCGHQRGSWTLLGPGAPHSRRPVRPGTARQAGSGS